MKYHFLVGRDGKPVDMDSTALSAICRGRRFIKEAQILKWLNGGPLPGGPKKNSQDEQPLEQGSSPGGQRMIECGL